MATYDLVVSLHRPRRLCLRGGRSAHSAVRSPVVLKEPTRAAGLPQMSAAMPSKALRQSLRLFDEAGHSFARLGVSVFGRRSLDLAVYDEFNSRSATATFKGVEFLMKKNKIDVLYKCAGKIPPGAQGEVRSAAGKTAPLRPKSSYRHVSDIARLNGLEDRREASRVVAGALSARQGAVEPLDRRRAA